MTPDLLTLLTFAAVALAIVGLYSLLTDLFLRDRDRVRRRFDQEFRQLQRDKVQKSPLFKNLGQPAGPTPADEAAPGLRRRFARLVEQSGLDLTPRRLATLMSAAGLLLGAVAWLASGNPVFGGGAGLLGVVAPLFYVQFRRQRRLGKMLAQLPDAFDLMARVIRAGQTISQALQAVAEEFEPPLAGEFTYCFEQQNLGLPPDVALQDLAHRTGLVEIKILVLALLVQRQTGGNLAELLEKLAALVRERFRIAGKIRVLTAEGRFQAILLLAMPPVVFGLLLIFNRDYAQTLFVYPNLLIGMAVFMGIGAFWIRKIVHFDF